VKRVTWGRVYLTGVWVSVEESEESYLGRVYLTGEWVSVEESEESYLVSCVFVNAKARVNIACKYEGAVRGGR
jgi:hypothetical protein